MLVVKQLLLGLAIGLILSISLDVAFKVKDSQQVVVSKAEYKPVFCMRFPWC